ncbi:MAG: 50S ribosomal protein L11 methyltransferase [Bacteroidota bacterium]
MKNTVYIEYNFEVSPLQPTTDILMAELGEAGFESFVETKEGVMAYILKEYWDSNILESIQIINNPEFNIDYNIAEIEQENWNATWEENFSSIHVGGECVVRAPFHDRSNVAYDIVIEPKMSFGTGHHETTYMMIQHVLREDFKMKSVLDMGSGTGVLAILAAMKGAKTVDAIDIDHWCYLNAKENVERNNCPQINVLEGDSRLLAEKKYDIILANINRNILLEDISLYVKSLNSNGIVFLSGFYQKDLPVITEKCTALRLKFEKNIEKNNWVAAKYVF